MDIIIEELEDQKAATSINGKVTNCSLANDNHKWVLDEKIAKKWEEKTLLGRILIKKNLK